MKVLLAAPQDKTVLGTITGYCERALRTLGNEVRVFDFRRRPYSKGKFISCVKSIVRPLFPSLPSPYDVPAVKSATDQSINNALVEDVASYKPDVLLVFCGENISPRALTSISKELKVPTVNWFHDTLLSPFRQEFIRQVLPYYDYVFMIDAQDVLTRINIHAKFIKTLPLGCDPEVHKKIDLSAQEIEEYGSDVAFVGTVTSERQKVLEELAVFKLKIWGRWEKEPKQLRGCYQKKDVYTDDAVKIYNAAKIVLDIHSLFGIAKDIFNVTPRAFEVPASGAFLLANYSLQIYDFYKPKEEIITYRTIDELKYLIKYYLEHDEERCAIAHRAYQRAQKEHTYQQRLKVLLGSINA